MELDEMIAVMAASIYAAKMLQPRRQPVMASTAALMQEAVFEAQDLWGQVVATRRAQTRDT
jgi:hypothetical protein